MITTARARRICRENDISFYSDETGEQIVDRLVREMTVMQATLDAIVGAESSYPGDAADLEAVTS